MESGPTDKFDVRRASRLQKLASSTKWQITCIFSRFHSTWTRRDPKKSSTWFTSKALNTQRYWGDIMLSSWSCWFSSRHMLLPNRRAYIDTKHLKMPSLSSPQPKIVSFSMVCRTWRSMPISSFSGWCDKNGIFSMAINTIWRTLVSKLHMKYARIKLFNGSTQMNVSHYLQNLGLKESFWICSKKV